MLEFPEIVCIREQLQKTVVGKRIADVAIEHKDTFAGTACPVCGTPIEKLSFEGGASYVCPACQPL